VAVSSILQNRYDISELDNEKAYVNNPYWLQELYLCREMFFRQLHSLLKSWRSHFKTLLWNKASRTATEKRALHCQWTPASYLEHACM